MARKSRASSATLSLVDPPPPAERKWINLVIGLFLASQVAIPLSYYLYKEPTNERFAWRMFSSVQMGDWSRMQIVERTRDGSRLLQQTVPVHEMLIESSRRNLYEGHPDYRDKFLRFHLANSPQADEVRYEAQGIWPSGKPMPPVRAEIHRRDGLVRRAAY
jgi:hypothetical protein